MLDYEFDDEISIVDVLTKDRSQVHFYKENLPTYAIKNSNGIDNEINSNSFDINSNYNDIAPFNLHNSFAQENYIPPDMISARGIVPNKIFYEDLLSENEEFGKEILFDLSDDEEKLMINLNLTEILKQTDISNETVPSNFMTSTPVKEKCSNINKKDEIHTDMYIKENDNFKTLQKQSSPFEELPSCTSEGENGNETMDFNYSFSNFKAFENDDEFNQGLKRIYNFFNNESQTDQTNIKENETTKDKNPNPAKHLKSPVNKSQENVIKNVGQIKKHISKNSKKQDEIFLENGQQLVGNDTNFLSDFSKSRENTIKADILAKKYQKLSSLFVFPHLPTATLYPMEKNKVKIVPTDIKNYTRSLENKLNIDDSNIDCEECQRSYRRPCEIHNVALILNISVAKDGNVNDRAKYTTPWPLKVRSLSGHLQGQEWVITEADLPKGLIFGPYEGDLVESVDQDDLRFAWKIQMADCQPQYVTAQNPSTSNWLRYVRFADCTSQSNVAVFMYRGHIFYRTNEAIDKDSELLINGSYTDNTSIAFISESKECEANASQDLSQAHFSQKNKIRKETNFHLQNEYPLRNLPIKREYDQDQWGNSDSSVRNKSEPIIKSNKRDLSNLDLIKKEKDEMYFCRVCHPWKLFRSVIKLQEHRAIVHGLDVQITTEENVNLDIFSENSEIMKSNQNENIAKIIETVIQSNCYPVKDDNSANKHTNIMNEAIDDGFFKKSENASKNDNQVNESDETYNKEDIKLQNDNSKQFYKDVCDGFSNKDINLAKNVSLSASTSIPEPKNIYACIQCESKSEDIFKLIKHDLFHFKSLPVQCGRCYQGFKSFDKFLAHSDILTLISNAISAPIDAHLYVNDLNCIECRKLLKHTRNVSVILREHMLKKHNMGLNEIISSYKNLNIFAKNMSKNETEEIFNCPLCFQKNIEKENMDSHFQAHLRSNVHKCTKCHVWLSSETDIEIHNKCHEISVENVEKELNCANSIPSFIKARLQMLLLTQDKTNIQKCENKIKKGIFKTPLAPKNKISKQISEDQTKQKPSKPDTYIYIDENSPLNGNLKLALHDNEIKSEASSTKGIRKETINFTCQKCQEIFQDSLEYLHHLALHSGITIN